MRTLAEITLSAGQHNGADQGMCAMEAVAWYMDETHSDHPQCVSPAIAAAMRTFNDWMSDEKRNEVLKPLLLEVIGTNTTLEDEITRAKIAVEYAQRWAASAAAESAAAPAAAWAARVSAARAASAAASAAAWAARAAWAAAPVAAARAAARAASAAASAAWAAARAARAESFDYASIGEMIIDMCKVGK